MSKKHEKELLVKAIKAAAQELVNGGEEQWNTVLLSGFEELSHKIGPGEKYRLNHAICQLENWVNPQN